MDGEDEFFSGNHSDDGSGTPVQDENAPGSDADEDMRSEPRHSEDEGSDGEGDAAGSRANGGGSGSDRDVGRGEDSDSDKDGPGHDSDSEPERPRPADSDDDEEEAASPPKRRGSTSENEEEQKPNASDSENEEPSKPQPAPSDAGSDSENEAPKRKKIIDSDEDDDDDTKADDKKEEGSGKWKGVMQSDSEEEDEGRAKPDAGSDQEQEGQSRRVAEDSDDDEDKPVKRKKAILSDSEDDDDEKVAKKSRPMSAGENSDSDAASDIAEKTHAAKLRELGSDSEEEEKPKEDSEKKDEKTLFGSDSESGEDEEEKMIADIFGESGDEDEEFTGFNQEELEGEKAKPQDSKAVAADDSDSDEGVDRGGRDTISDFMSDFDMMLARKKAQSKKRRRNRDGGTFISDADDVVSAMITKMTEAAEEDRTLNSQKKPALKKLTLLPTVVMHLKKQDLKETFIDSGVMSAIKEWISPLPDKSLPALRIREELLRILQELPSVSQETLKHSGIGRAVMFLYKHPKESRGNKNLALKLINEWSRPIFGLSSNYKCMTREEREQRDLDQQVAPRGRRLSEPEKVDRPQEPDVFAPPPPSSGGQTPRRDLEKVLTGEEKALRPGDPGFCARARVPMPSNKDYVVRPKWNVDTDSNRGPVVKKAMSRVDKQMRRFADIRRLTKTGHAVKISVEGNRMPL
ncbi:protein IWS1 homolog isoform X1 [Alosa alosa]|uniref:protein IWS1 homolog isoform X1 n=1 Tax=Alosa alosa TaxID=278164 RepID=UPI0020151748|nr:protein IWS1 homolog isoform X1 [Alosa alosa]